CMVTKSDEGRTVKASISKVGVSCIAVISQENIACRDVPAAPPEGVLIVAPDGDLSTGVVGICVVLGMVGSVVVCGNTASAAASFGKLDAGSGIASAAYDWMSAELVSYGIPFTCSIDST